MKYLVLGWDGKDKDARKRRLKVREAHIKLGNKLRSKGYMDFGVAILDEQKRMIGSMLVCEFSSKKELNKWLAVEPYVQGMVWKRIEIHPCRVGPSFSDIRELK